MQTCKVKSAPSQVHDLVVYRLNGIFGSVGHRVKIHKITPATDKERGDLEIKDYVGLQKPQEQTDRLPPSRTLILDFTLTHTRYDSSHVHTTGQLTNTRRSDNSPEFDGVLREVVRKKILHYRQLLFLHVHREPSTLYDESVGLILAKDSDVRISIPLDLSSRPFIPLPRIYTPLRHWVGHGTGTPKDKDEVKRREVCECEG